ncbi:transposase, IS4 family [mine drainage metagenome]|uniref:Transposase, IS4 family n=1 Tax=mine drainage metagenome TaxID=410659 RepID=T1BIS3_9ZZZZ
MATIKINTSVDFLPGHSFNLDFHSVPYYGEHPVIERHFVSMRSRRQPSILAFLAQDADGRAFCYANADSRLATYANLARLEEMGITFVTLRRRPAALLKEIAVLPRSA